MATSKRQKRLAAIRAQRAARFVDKDLNFITIRDLEGKPVSPTTGQILPEGTDPGRENLVRKKRGQSPIKADVPRVQR
jgi:hypothetical protein